MWKHSGKKEIQHVWRLADQPQSSSCRCSPRLCWVELFNQFTGAEALYQAAACLSLEWLLCSNMTGGWPPCLPFHFALWFFRLSAVYWFQKGCHTLTGARVTSRFLSENFSLNKDLFHPDCPVSFFIQTFWLDHLYSLCLYQWCANCSTLSWLCTSTVSFHYPACDPIWSRALLIWSPSSPSIVFMAVCSLFNLGVLDVFLHWTV